MPRKKKETNQQPLSTQIPTTIIQYEINWQKIADDVRAAGEMIKNYPQDDGPLTDDQIRQIKETAPKFKKTKKTVK